MKVAVVWGVVRQQCTDFSEDYAALSDRYIPLMDQQDPLKCVFSSTRIHGITSQQMAAFKERTFHCYFCTRVYDLY